MRGFVPNILVIARWPCSPALARAHLLTLVRAARNEAGFTLVEVIAAIAILSLGLGVLLGLIGNGLRETAQSSKMVQAGMLAQSLLAQIGAEIPVREWQGSGEFSDGFRWQLTMQSFGDAADRENWPMSAFRVSVEVNWSDGVRERVYRLATLRLVPKEQGR
jgi:general secretion pathway protein I